MTNSTSIFAPTRPSRHGRPGRGATPRTGRREARLARGRRRRSSWGGRPSACPLAVRHELSLVQLRRNEWLTIAEAGAGLRVGLGRRSRTIAAKRGSASRPPMPTSEAQPVRRSHDRLVTVACPRCGGHRTVNARSARRIRSGQSEGTCAMCRSSTVVNVTPELRTWAQETWEARTYEERMAVALALLPTSEGVVNNRS